MASWEQVFFHWPDGGIWSNIIASLIWASPTILVASLNLKHHRKILHQRIDAIHERLRRQEKSHEELHAKIDAIHSHLGIDLGKDTE